MISLAFDHEFVDSAWEQDVKGATIPSAPEAQHNMDGFDLDWSVMQSSLCFPQHSRSSRTNSASSSLPNSHGSTTTVQRLDCEKDSSIFPDLFGWDAALPLPLVGSPSSPAGTAQPAAATVKDAHHYQLVPEFHHSNNNPICSREGSSPLASELPPAKRHKPEMATASEALSTEPPQQWLEDEHATHAAQCGVVPDALAGQEQANCSCSTHSRASDINAAAAAETATAAITSQAGNSVEAATAGNSHTASFGAGLAVGRVAPGMGLREPPAAVYVTVEPGKVPASSDKAVLAQSQIALQLPVQQKSGSSTSFQAVTGAAVPSMNPTAQAAMNPHAVAAQQSTSSAQHAGTGASAIARSYTLANGETVVRTRAEALARYREKRACRSHTKKIRYHLRKVNADKRPRIKGRFVKKQELEHMEAAEADAPAQVGSGCWGEDMHAAATAAAGPSWEQQICYFSCMQAAGQPITGSETVVGLAANDTTAAAAAFTQEASLPPYKAAAAAQQGADACQQLGMVFPVCPSASHASAVAVDDFGHLGFDHFGVLDSTHDQLLGGSLFGGLDRASSLSHACHDLLLA